MKGITHQDETYQVIPLYEDSKYTVTHAHKWMRTHRHGCLAQEYAGKQI